MKNYHATFGYYVRAYTTLDFTAPDDDAAKAAAIAAFKLNLQDLSPEDFDYNNIAMPSLSSMYSDEDTHFSIEGLDFPVSSDDARDLAAPAMLDFIQRLATMDLPPELREEARALVESATYTPPKGFL
jgi:hypothetical protein